MSAPSPLVLFPRPQSRGILNALVELATVSSITLGDKLMSDAAMTSHEHAVSKRQPRTMAPEFNQQLITSLVKFGVATVLVLLYYLQVFKPDQDARRESERATATAVVQTAVTQNMIVEQLRRSESSDIVRDASLQELTRSSQEQTRILQQIMVDQRRGAWKEAVPNE